MKLFRIILINVVVCGSFGAKLGAYLNYSGYLTQPSWSSIEIGLGVGTLIGVVSALIISMVTNDVWNKESQPETQSIIQRLATDRVK